MGTSALLVSEMNQKVRPLRPRCEGVHVELVLLFRTDLIELTSEATVALVLVVAGRGLIADQCLSLSFPFPSLSLPALSEGKILKCLHLNVEFCISPVREETLKIRSPGA